MTGKLEGKISVVTGGGSGIGLATVKKFLAEGATVVIAGTSDDRNQAIADELNEQYPGKCAYKHCDVREKDDDVALINWVKDTYGRIDIYICNAGYAGPTDPEPATFDFEVFDRCFKTNVYGLHYQMTTLIPIMKEQGGGTITLIGSASPLQPCNCPSYTASKGATRAYFMDLANMFAPDHVRMNKVMPGVIVTDMTAQITGPDANPEFKEFFKNTIPSKQFCPPEAIADALCWISSDEAEHVYGAELRVDDGMMNMC